ncbi:MAG: hypothetical protein EON51_17975 [Acinetobacter sp.]|nr:MAG: hypothetical protein EON51_17975 [Acinetobacter sp.]
MKTTKFKKIIPILLVSVFFSCNSSPDPDKFLGKWVSVDPKDSLSLPVEIYKTQSNFFVKIPYRKSFKEFSAVYNKEENVLKIENVFKFFYLPDSNFLKINVKGNSENFRPINDNEAKVRLEGHLKRLKTDSRKVIQVKTINPFKDYKNHDAEILNRIIKRRKNIN